MGRTKVGRRRSPNNADERINECIGKLLKIQKNVWKAQDKANQPRREAYYAT